MAILSEKTWKRHSNPWSGWTRVLTFPLMAVGLYFHNFWILALVVFWAIINPMIFPEPKSIDNWMSKGVLGERLYYQQKKYLKKDLPTLLNVLNLPVALSFLYFAWNQEFLLMVYSGLLSCSLKFWFVDRMVTVYEKSLKGK
jgi:hypothetical protein